MDLTQIRTYYLVIDVASLCIINDDYKLVELNKELILIL